MKDCSSSRKGWLKSWIGRRHENIFQLRNGEWEKPEVNEFLAAIVQQRGRFSRVLHVAVNTMWFCAKEDTNTYPAWQWVPAKDKFYIYSICKRIKTQRGSKNPVLILPDAGLEMATKIKTDSAFGCTG